MTKLLGTAFFYFFVTNQQFGWTQKGHQIPENTQEAFENSFSEELSNPSNTLNNIDTWVRDNNPFFNIDSDTLNIMLDDKKNRAQEAVGNQKTQLLNEINLIERALKQLEQRAAAEARREEVEKATLARQRILGKLSRKVSEFLNANANRKKITSANLTEFLNSLAPIQLDSRNTPILLRLFELKSAPGDEIQNKNLLFSFFNFPGFPNEKTFATSGGPSSIGEGNRLALLRHYSRHLNQNYRDNQTVLDESFDFLSKEFPQPGESPYNNILVSTYRRVDRSRFDHWARIQLAIAKKNGNINKELLEDSIAEPATQSIDAYRGILETDETINSDRYQRR